MFINPIKELEQRSPQLGYISSFNTCSHTKGLFMHNLYPPKIVHGQAFCMGTCLEGDSAYPHAWRVASSVINRLHACHWCHSPSILNKSQLLLPSSFFHLLFASALTSLFVFELSSQHLAPSINGLGVEQPRPGAGQGGDGRRLGGLALAAVRLIPERTQERSPERTPERASERTPERSRSSGVDL